MWRRNCDDKGGAGRLIFLQWFSESKSFPAACMMHWVRFANSRRPGWKRKQPSSKKSPQWQIRNSWTRRVNIQCISSVATAACYVSFGGRVARNFVARSRSGLGVLPSVQKSEWAKTSSNVSNLLSILWQKRKKWSKTSTKVLSSSIVPLCPFAMPSSCQRCYNAIFLILQVQFIFGYFVCSQGGVDISCPLQKLGLAKDFLPSCNLSWMTAGLWSIGEKRGLAMSAHQQLFTYKLPQYICFIYNILCM